MYRVVILAALLAALPASAVDIEWVYVGNPGNSSDTETNCRAEDCGSVPYEYYISKYEITNTQYAEFLNAVAASDPFELWSMSMVDDVLGLGGITRSGSPGSYTYEVKAGFEDKPVVWVWFYDALRFANWLNNGQGSVSTEDGAYTLLGGTPLPTNWDTVERNAGAVTFIPSENEWYKAAYYDPTLPGYYDYPTGTDVETTCATPSAAPNNANCWPGGPGGVNGLTDVGSYTGSPSPYGTFDQGGNVAEWNEQKDSGSGRVIRGGDWNAGASFFVASNPGQGLSPNIESRRVGFRVVTAPEPAEAVLILTGALVLAGARRARARLSP